MFLPSFVVNYCPGFTVFRPIYQRIYYAFDLEPVCEVYDKQSGLLTYLSCQSIALYSALKGNMPPRWCRYDDQQSFQAHKDSDKRLPLSLLRPHHWLID